MLGQKQVPVHDGRAALTAAIHTATTAIGTATTLATLILATR